MIHFYIYFPYFLQMPHLICHIFYQLDGCETNYECSCLVIHFASPSRFVQYKPHNMAVYTGFTFNYFCVLAYSYCEITVHCSRNQIFYILQHLALFHNIFSIIFFLVCRNHQSNVILM